MASSGGNKTKAANEDKYGCFHANDTNDKNKRENTENDALKKWNHSLEFFYSDIFHNSTAISLKCFMNLSYTNTRKRPNKHLTFNSGM